MTRPSSWKPTPFGSRRSLALHVALGLFAPVLGACLVLVSEAVGSDAAWLMAKVLSIPYMLAPLVGYGLLLSDRGALPPEEPCLRSGTVAGRHWFEFESLPGRRLWSADPDETARVRRRAVPLPEGTGFEMVLRQPRADRALAHRLAGLRTARDVVLGITTSFLATGVVMGVAAAGSAWLSGTGLEGWEGATAYAAFLGFAFWLPSVVTFLMGFWSLFLGVYLLWNRLLAPRGVDEVRWTRDVLHTPVGDLDLNEPGLGAEVDYTPFGARLTVWNRAQRLTLHGDHGLLVALREAIRKRARGTGDGSRERVPEALARALKALET